MNRAGTYEDINFLPQWYLRQQSRRRSVERQAILLVLLVAGLVALWSITHNQHSALRMHQEALQAQVIATQGQLTEVSKLQTARNELSRQLRIYRELARPIAFHQINSTLAALTPETVYLDKLSITTAMVQRKLAIKSEPTPGRTGKPEPVIERTPVVAIMVTGTAPSDVEIANYVGRLAGSNLFREVKMVRSRKGEVNDAVTREFEIHMQVPLDRDYRVERINEGVARADG